MPCKDGTTACWLGSGAGADTALCSPFPRVRSLSAYTPAWKELAAFPSLLWCMFGTSQ